MSKLEIHSNMTVDSLFGMPRLEIVYRPIIWFKEYAQNPRKNDAAVDRMCASIREFGFAVAMLCRSTGEIVDGHLRFKGAQKIGLAELPVVLCDHWTEAQVRAFRLMVNRSVAWAEWDYELLALELQEIQESDFDLSLTGFTPGEIDKLLLLDDNEKADEAPPLPESPVSQLGDLWLLGPHRVLCGDSTNSDQMARLLGGKKPILLFQILHTACRTTRNGENVPG
jgi:ParB-like chromosome segregation protein Spo0J